MSEKHKYVQKMGLFVFIILRAHLLCFRTLNSWSIKNKYFLCDNIKLLNPTGHVMYQRFNIQQLYVLPTLYLCVLYLSENKQRLVPLTA